MPTDDGFPARPLDLHLHGAGGVPVPPDGDVAELDRTLDRLSVGTPWESTGYEYLATLPAPTRPPTDIVRHVADAVRALDGCTDDGSARSCCVGIRVEGCFLNPDRAGVWPVETFCAPDIGLLDELIDAGDGNLRIVDVAPELPGAEAMIEHACFRGLVVALAHSDATYEQAIRGIDAGATLATHTFNAMRPFHHRDPGIIAAVLADPRVTCEVICDGQHVHPGAVALAVAASGSGGIAAISDASPFACCPPGEYRWRGIELRWDGERMADMSGQLAGAGHVQTAAPAFLERCGLSPSDALRACSVTPRRVLGWWPED